MTGSDTRRRLLDAAITLVARDGMRALSHRSLETAAGVARGSTTYHLGTSRQIVEALLEHVAARDESVLRDALSRFAVEQLSSPAASPLDTIERLAAALLADPDTLVVRYALMLEAARDESLRPAIRRWRDFFVSIGEPILAGLGVPDPRAAARDFLALMDGIIFEHITTGRPDLPGRLTRTLGAYLAHATAGHGPRPNQPPTP